MSDRTQQTTLGPVARFAAASRERMRRLNADPAVRVRSARTQSANRARKRDEIGRDAEIIARRALGESLVSIAADFGITRQRVYQICTRAASSPRDADTAGPAAAADRGGAGDSQGRA